jgi:secretion/DNA translocation related CpaE-like protein
VLAGSAELAGPVHEQAAAAGVTVRAQVVAPDLAPPALVLADEAHLTDAAAAGRRAGPLHVLARGPVPDSVYRRALDAGAVSVIAVPDDLRRLAGLLADLDRPRHARVVGVTGGAGGVGASVLAAAVALRSVERARGSLGAGEPSHATLLIDLDPEGPGLGRLVEGTVGAGVSWADLIGLDGRLAASELRASVPTASGVGLLTWPDDRLLRAADAPVAEVVAAATRGHDWVVLDIPRTAADLPRVACDLLVVVVDGSVGGVASAVRRLARIRAAGHAVGVVVRTRRSSAGADDVARVLGVPLIGELRDDRRLREQLDLGLGPLRGRRCPLGRAADAVLDEVPARTTSVRSAWPA